MVCLNLNSEKFLLKCINMIKSIRKSKFSKILASYLALQIVISVIQPAKLYALTGGPDQPEFNSFTPIGTSEMVDLSSGDFKYNIPIMDVGGYPLNLSYNSGVGMDQEASWVGLGWNLNVGQITRSVRGIPDDFKGDDLIYRNNIKDNRTVGLTFNINPQFWGLGDMGLGVNGGITVQHNNYTGLGFQPSYGISYEFNDHVSAGLNLSSSAANGASASPSLSLSAKRQEVSGGVDRGFSSSVGVGYNSRQGLTSFNMSAGYSMRNKNYKRSRGFSEGTSGSISFLNNTFTPSKRLAFNNSNLSFAVSLGLDAWGVDAEIGVTGFGITQKLDSKTNTSNSYGFNNTHLASKNDILDFNKEKESVISKNTLNLPITNYTYDIYQIQGQGVGGMFRPFRSQVGEVFSQSVQDKSNDDSFGGEGEGGTGWHVGLDFTLADGFSRTGKWNTPVSNYFKENTNYNIDYEPVYYKTIGEYTVDLEASEMLEDKLGGEQPIRIGIGGNSNGPGKYAENKYEVKQSNSISSTGNHSYTQESINSPIQREHREIRNTAIKPVYHSEVELNPFVYSSTSQEAKPHHIAGYEILKTDGAKYVYGETVYNNIKQENTFAVDREPAINSALDGTVSYTGQENSTGNDSGVDNYFNSITTPGYAHTYLLTGVLSSDYEDLTGDGMTDDDLGSYTKFNYEIHESSYNWRVPYQIGKASFNQGLYSNTKDQKGSIVSGTKELKYIHTIETKTHVAYFKLLNRNDAKEAGYGNNYMQKIDKIFLFSKPEYQKLVNAENNQNPENIDENILIKNAIKVAHFEYDYSLCRKLPNNVNTLGVQVDPSLIENGDTITGKLTLKKLYFTYRDSQMGAYTPYKFHYTEDNMNPDYSLKAYDIWGNYKPNNAINYNVFNNPLSPQEFPYVQQLDTDLQDQYVTAWSLTSIDLPSGGKIDLTYESDDYQYVQDRKAMQMFKIAGVTKESNIPSGSDIGNTTLYKNGSYSEDAKYLIVELQEENLISTELFEQKYLAEHYDKPIFFRFLLNMSKSTGQGNQSNDYDYVEGYFKIDKNESLNTFSSNGKFYGAIPMQFSDMEGGVNGQKNVNPISKAGWYFGQKYLPKKVYGLPQYSSAASIKDIINQLKSDFGAIDEIIRGPNAKLRNQKLIARRYIPEKSWIRLLNPSGTKLGGGSRIRKIEMHDNWDAMMGSTQDIYKQFYGQEYSYQLDDGTSSGVATYEPNASKENPFVEPFYSKDESLVAPREVNYTEKPFGESYFPSAQVTYSKVEVKNLSRERQDGNQSLSVNKHATGKIVQEFYTSKDFPTKVDYTTLDGPNNFYSNDNNMLNQGLGGILGLNVKVNTELTLSQGFSVQTNDMNGKEKRQSVYSELGEYISGVEYKYNVNDDGSLNNRVPVVKENGEIITTAEVGMHYDVINDFFENYTYSNMSGNQTNVVAIPIPAIPPVWVIPTSVPQSSTHKTVLHTATTTKVIHRTGVLKEKIAYDLGSSVSTKNLAWDSKTGDVVLTETSNEYNDQYYNLNFPSYWSYPQMGFATKNLGISSSLINQGGFYHLPNNSDLHEFFTEGDELNIQYRLYTFPPIIKKQKAWVIGFNSQGTGIKLMDREGEIISSGAQIFFKISRSGYRNLQKSSMASITLMKNPINDDQIDQSDFLMNLSALINPRIINASAIEYKDFWPSPCEGNIPQSRYTLDEEGNEIYLPESLCLNPYVYNIKGDYRAVKSYAYLTGRNEGDGLGVRNQGFFNEFSPFYTLDNNQKWVINSNNQDRWTFASEVTRYSPYGAELENKDALGRHSSAQYGYKYTLPTAVSSNSSYQEMGFDGFEDYTAATLEKTHFGFQNVPGISNSISNERSHSGKKSIKIEAGDEIEFNSTLESCNSSSSSGGGGGSVMY